MTVSALLRWQWGGYPRYHQSRSNLLGHIAAVPMFLVGNIALVSCLALRQWLGAAIAVVVIIVAVALQGRGHRREPVPPEPFTGPLNAVSRLFLEQWVTFPRFVVSGGWLTAVRRSSTP